MSSKAKYHVVYQAVARGAVCETIFESWFGLEGAEHARDQLGSATSKGFITRKEAQAFIETRRPPQQSKQVPSVFRAAFPTMLNKSVSGRRYMVFTDASCANNPGFGTYTSLIFLFDPDTFYGSNIPVHQDTAFEGLNVIGDELTLTGWSQAFTRLFQLSAIITGWEDNCTNQRGELAALISAINWLEKKRIDPSTVQLFSDSNFSLTALAGNYNLDTKIEQFIQCSLDNKELDYQKNPYLKRIEHVPSLHTKSEELRKGAFHLFNVFCDLISDITNQNIRQNAGWLCLEPGLMDNTQRKGSRLVASFK